MVMKVVPSILAGFVELTSPAQYKEEMFEEFQRNLLNHLHRMTTAERVALISNNVVRHSALGT
jgi:hypothetical protein